MTEDTPQRAQGKKGRIRIEMAAAILRAYGEGKLALHHRPLLRLSRPLGTASTVGDNLMKPGLRGQAGALARLARPAHTLNYLEDGGPLVNGPAAAIRCSVAASGYA